MTNTATNTIDRNLQVDAPAWERGLWLFEQQRELDQGHSVWLNVLATFDRDRGWELDGQSSCVAWMMWKLKMARSTAFEKLRVAHALADRPLVAAAYDAGDLSWTALRGITQLDRPTADVDEALLRLAREGSVGELQAALRHYRLIEDQEGAPGESRRLHRGIHFYTRPDGLETAQIILDHLEMEELKTALSAFIDRVVADEGEGSGETSGEEAPAGESTAVDSEGSAPSEPVAPRAADRGSGESTAVDSGSAGIVPEDSTAGPGSDAAADGGMPDGRLGRPADALPYWQRRVDAFIDLVRTAMAHRQGPQTSGPDRYLIHLIQTEGEDGWHGRMEHLDGRPLEPDQAARVRCDASTIVHRYGKGGDELHLGRKTRQWSTAQHRAVRVRDGGTCRFPGCTHTVVDLHHFEPWEDGGATDIDNAVSLCPRHHTLIHEGFSVVGAPNGPLIFARPDHVLVGVTTPRRGRPIS